MKKGFTLIELLAVIVILAIIALIATPVVLSIIEEVKENSMLRSADGYLNAVEISITKAMLNNKTVVPGKYRILESGNVCLEIYNYEEKTCLDNDGNTENNELKIETKGQVPNSGVIEIKNSEIETVGLVYSNNGTIIKGNNGLSFGEFPLELLDPGLYDENNNLVYTWDALIENNLLTIYNTEVVTNWLYSIDSTLSGKLIIDDSITGIEPIDLPSGITDLVIGKGVTSILDNTFSSNSNLKTVIIPDSVTSIGNGAFYGNQGLTSITIPDSVTYIDEAAFAECTNLKSVIIGNGLTSIGYPVGIFAGCTSLTDVYYKKSQQDWNSITNITYAFSWPDEDPLSVKINYNYKG